MTNDDFQNTMKGFCRKALGNWFVRNLVSFFIACAAVVGIVIIVLCFLVFLSWIFMTNNDNVGVMSFLGFGLGILIYLVTSVTIQINKELSKEFEEDKEQ